MSRFTGQDISRPERHNDEICHHHAATGKEQERKTDGELDSFHGHTGLRQTAVAGYKHLTAGATR